MSTETRVWLSSRKCANGRRSYHLRWIERGVGWRSKCIGTDKRRAEGERVRMEQELRRGTYNEIRKTTWEAFANEHVSRQPGESNRVATRRVRREFAELFDYVDPKQVTFGMVEKYVSILRDRGNKATTRNTKLKHLRAAFNAAVRRGYLARNPMDQLRLEPEEEKINRVVEKEEQQVVEGAAVRLYGFRWRALVLGALGTGGRRSELFGLPWVDVDLDDAKVVFRSTKAKRDRIVPITPELVETLRKVEIQTLKDGGPFCGLDDGFYWRWERLRKKAGCPDLCLHDLRRTYITRLIRAGVPLPTVQKLAGHSDIKTTLKYYNQVNDADLRAAVDKLREAAG